MKPDTHNRARHTRTYRRLHRWVGIPLLLFLLLMATTGLLLGWKKHSGGYLLAKTQRGTSTDLRRWLPLDSLRSAAVRALQDSVSADLSTELDRIDARPDKGIVKFTFTGHYWGVQVDAATGNILSIERRRADFIEHLHDGSLIDRAVGIAGEYVKLTYTTLTGAGLLLLTISGFWLWYNPRRMRRAKTPPAPRRVTTRT